jgi:hypothetical protein
MFGLKREPRVESVGLLVTGNNKRLAKAFAFISVSPEPLFHINKHSQADTSCSA